MGQTFTKVKKPIGAVLIYGESSTDTYEAISIDTTTKGLKVVSYGYDGTNAKLIKTDASGRVEVIAGFDGTNYKPILTDNNGQILIGTDGTSARAIRTDASGTVFIASDLSYVKESKINLFNTTITDSQPILATDLMASNPPSLFRIYVVISTACTFEVIRKVGTDVVYETLNSGAQLNPNCAYLFDVIVDSGESINFRAIIDNTGTTTATLFKLSVVEKFEL